MKDVQKSVLVNVLIFFGLLLFFAVAVIAYWTSDKAVLQLLSQLFLCLQFLFGLFVLVLAIKRTHKATHLFIGSLLAEWAVNYFLVDNVLSCGLKSFWPVFGVFAGILLFVSGFYKYKKIKFGYAIPAVTLVGMGIWYSFFSFGIIKTPFIVVVKRLGPVFVLVLVLLLIALFLVQKRNKKFVVADDETGTFSDEDEEIIKRV
ncbi:MAG: hypothetical protein K6C97_00185 [Treponema sp.]|nr:hypothetical protein [Treponema sp.]